MILKAAVIIGRRGGFVNHMGAQNEFWLALSGAKLYKNAEMCYNKFNMETQEGFTFISGATGGIGRAFCDICVQEGDLFLTGRSASRLEELRTHLQIRYPTRKIEYFACDLTDEAARAEMFSYIAERGLRFSRLINVAGADIQKAFEKYTQEKLTFQCRTNFEAAVSLTRFVLENRTDLLEILTVGSISAVYPMPYFALYSATKKAEEQFFYALRTELSGRNVKVTVVEPGGVYTRPDVIADIRGQGLWGKLSAKTPAYIARKSLSAVCRNKRVYRPGFWNKVIATVPRLLPPGVRLHFIARRWKKLEKDAF